MRNAAVVLILALAVTACSLQQVGTPTPVPQPTIAPVTPSLTPTPEPPSYAVTVVLDPTLTGQDPSITDSWTAYANARADWIRSNITPEAMAIAGYHPSFDEEVAGRTALAQAWIAQKRITPALKNVYLDQLVQVYQAYFIKEYTWTYFALDTWEEPHGLYLSAFKRWLREHPWKPIHIPQTLATVRVRMTP